MRLSVREKKSLYSCIYFHGVLMFPVELWIYLADIVPEVLLRSKRPELLRDFLFC